VRPLLQTPRIVALDVPPERRNHRNLNQSELGKRAKLNAAHIAQIENGARNASVPTLVVLGKALDVPWNWLSPAR
jgi:transcriptional regulator with XRE-family HTH domain